MRRRVAEEAQQSFNFVGVDDCQRRREPIPWELVARRQLHTFQSLNNLCLRSYANEIARRWRLFDSVLPVRARYYAEGPTGIGKSHLLSDLSTKGCGEWLPGGFRYQPTYLSIDDLIIGNRSSRQVVGRDPATRIELIGSARVSSGKARCYR